LLLEGWGKKNTETASATGNAQHTLQRSAVTPGQKGKRGGGGEFKKGGE